MDPNLFHIDFEQLMEVLLTIIVLSFLVERALSILFESRTFIERTESGETLARMNAELGDSAMEVKPRKEKKGIKEFIAFIVSTGICFIWQFDAITIILQTKNEMTWYGMIITGAIIAGGSKGSVKLFKDLMGIRSTVDEVRQNVKKPKPGGTPATS